MKIKILYIFIGTILLSLLAFHNGAPLLMGDSIGYLKRAAQMQMSSHWASTYSFYCIGMSAGFASLWGIIFVQNLLCSWLIYENIVFLFPTKEKAKLSNQAVFIIAISILGLFTTLPWTSNLIMADIFIGTGFLAWFQLVFNDKKSLLIKGILFLIVCLSLIAHNSYKSIFLLFFLSVLMILGIEWYKNRKPKYLRQALMIVAVFLFSFYLLRPAINYPFLKKFGNSATSGSLIWIRQMQGDDYLKEFLDDYCEEYNFKLCEYKDKGAVNAIWNDISHGKRTPDNTTYVEWSKDFDQIVKVSFQDPKYLYYHTRHVVRKTAKIFLNNWLIVFYSDGFRKAIKKNLRKYISKNDLYRLTHSKQFDPFYFKKIENAVYSGSFHSKITVTWLGLNTINGILLILSMILIFWFLIKHRKTIEFSNLWYFLLFVLAIVFFNDLICGSVGNTHNSRYTMRINWLIVFGGLLVFFKIIETKFSQEIIDSPKSHTDQL